MNIVITTYNRSPSYLPATLRSLFASDCMSEVRLVIHERPTFLADTVKMHRPWLEGRWLSPEEEADKNLLGKRMRTCHVTKIALEQFNDDVLLLQDDVEFSPEWFTEWNRLLRNVVNPAIRMIALCCWVPDPKPQTKPRIEKYRPNVFRGLQAVYFGNDARKAAIASLRAAIFDKDGRIKESATSDTAPADDAILRTMLLGPTKITLSAVYPSLVQHIGDVSSIGSNKGVCVSPTFKGRT